MRLSPSQVQGLANGVVPVWAGRPAAEPLVPPASAQALAEEADLWLAAPSGPGPQTLPSHHP